jgi:hypothetical protein
MNNTYVRYRQDIYQCRLLQQICTHNSLIHEDGDDAFSRAVRVSGYRSRGPGFDSRRFQVFWEAVGLERGPLGLVSVTGELLGRNSSGSGQENREYDRGDPLRWPRNTLYPRRLLGRRSSLADQSHGVYWSCSITLAMKMATVLYADTWWV